MAEIVLVHGIDHEQSVAGTLESEWLSALAHGLTKISREDLATSVWHRGLPGAVDVRMAFYGDVFLSPEGEGLTAEEQQEIERRLILRDEATSRYVLENAATRSTDPGQRAIAARELDRLRGTPPEPMGVRSATRAVTHALLRLPYFGDAALSALGAAKPPVRQISRYFGEARIRRDVLDRVHKYLDAGTKVVIGHSLGCVVAYEALWERADAGHRKGPELLLTLGSPLGIHPVRRQLARRPYGPPTGLRRWANFADPDDIVAAHHDHTKLFPDPHHHDPDRRTEMTAKPVTVDNGSSPHTGTHYLVKKGCALRIAEALDARR
ncbi:hypothetical protein [Streptomyces sp. NPDC029041]|uniref:hypothetical protein n=1 Tax=Streptomyces sp. NPDC029041 TaxID=3155727 RepID=UPI0033F73021